MRKSLLALVASIGLIAALGVAAESQFIRSGPPLLQLSADPYSNSVAEHATEVEPDTFAVGSMIVSAFQAGRFEGGGSTNIGFATSKDAGKTWTSGFLPGLTQIAGGPYARASDPAVAHDAAHGVWLINSLPVGPSGHIPRGYPSSVVSRSTDGVTWTGPITVAPYSGGGADKTWITCDNHPSSPNFGHCYAEWDDVFSSPELRIHLNTSTDGGLTWGPTLAGGMGARGVGGQPLALPNGTVVVPFEGNGPREQAIISKDGGKSWSRAYLIAPEADNFSFVIRTGPLPSAQVDAAGTVYVVWQDCSFRTNCSTNDIVMSTSTDGVHWTAKVRIPIDPLNSPVDHINPGLGVDPNTSGANAHLGLTYYYLPSATCRKMQQCQLSVGYVSSRNGGQTWSAPTTLAGPMSDHWLAFAHGFFVGDYLATTFTSDGLAHSVFAVAAPPSNGLLNEAMFTTKAGLPVQLGGVQFSSFGEHPIPGVHSNHAWYNPNSPPNEKAKRSVERD